MRAHARPPALARASTRYHWASGFRFIRIPLGLAQAQIWRHRGTLVQSGAGNLWRRCNNSKGPG
jgi:hypothetical protein